MSEAQIIRTEYSDVMKKSYIDYAMSVIVARALPDVRDGLKPVQRRTLYDMHELGIRWDKPYRKCARIVGDTMGKYHPQGDSSIYEALVVMSQDFNKGKILFDGNGNALIRYRKSAVLLYCLPRIRHRQSVLLRLLSNALTGVIGSFQTGSPFGISRGSRQQQKQCCRNSSDQQESGFGSSVVLVRGARLSRLHICRVNIG